MDSLKAERQLATSVKASGAVRPVRCRAIRDSDIDAVVDLLTEGFAGRSKQYWRKGIERHLAKPLPEDLPRLGHLIESEEGIVGVLLALYSTREKDGRSSVRCNLSSWYVKPGFRGYAAMLDNVAMRRKDVTYFNISAVRRTWPMQEARGFQRYCRGSFLALPLLSPPRPNVRVRDATKAEVLDGLPEDEARILADHARYGCLCLVGTDQQGTEPFIFIRRPMESIRQRLGWSPVTYFQLVYCRSTAELPRFAHAIGRHLIRHHLMPWIVVDAIEPISGIPGRFIEGWGTKFCRGPVAMANGDLAYSELVLFGS